MSPCASGRAPRSTAQTSLWRQPPASCRRDAGVVLTLGSMVWAAPPLPGLRPPTRKARQKKPGEPVLVAEDPGQVFQSLTLENIRGSVMETPRAGCQSGPESLEGGAPAESSFWESGDYRSPGWGGGGPWAARMTPQGLRPRPGTAGMWVRGLALHRRAL